MILREAWSSIWAARDRRPIAEWAAEQVELPSVLTVKGKFNPELSRHFLAVFDALQDDHVRQVVVRKPVRGGGTLISDIWHAWARANDPGPAMVVMQSDQMAEDHGETRFMPLLLSVPAIKPLLPDDPRKLKTCEVLYKDGLPVYLSGFGINKLQTKGIRYLSADEVWLWPPGRIDEARGRLGDYARMQTDKILLVSQGGIEEDDFDRAYNEGHSAQWSVECAGCHQYFVPLWTHVRPDGSRAGMRWDEHKIERGEWDVEACLASVRYECPMCGHPHFDTPRTKQDWNRTGKYTDGRVGAARSKRSFHWNSVISNSWTGLVEEFLSAANALKGGLPEPMISFFQKKMAEPKSERSINDDRDEMRRARYDVEKAWEDELVRFMTIDRQDEDVYWVLVRAWSKNGESRRLWFGKVFGAAGLEAKAKEWKCVDVFVDSGFKPKGDNGVYSICIRNGWVALKGTDEPFFWHRTRRGRVQHSYSEVSSGDPEMGYAGAGRRECKLVRFSSPQLKDRLHQLISAGKWVEPVDSGDPSEKEYRKQMSAEYKKVKVNKFTGKREWVWVCPSGNNHAFDCACMQVLAATFAQIVPDLEFVAEPTDAASDVETSGTTHDAEGSGAGQPHGQTS